MEWFVSIKGLQKVHMIVYARLYNIYIHILNNIALIFLRDNTQHPSSPTSAISTIRICFVQCVFQGRQLQQTVHLVCRRLVTWWCKCYLHVHSCSKGIKSTEKNNYFPIFILDSYNPLDLMKRDSQRLEHTSTKFSDFYQDGRTIQSSGSSWPASAACL